MIKVARAIACDLDVGLPWEFEVFRGWQPGNELLSPRTREALVEWVNALDRLVPDELNYYISFSPWGYDASIELQDGYLAAAGGPFPIELTSTARKRLVTFNWEPIMADLRQRTMALDDEMGEPSGPIPQWFKDLIKNGGTP